MEDCVSCWRGCDFGLAARLEVAGRGGVVCAASCAREGPADGVSGSGAVGESGERAGGLECAAAGWVREYDAGVEEGCRAFEYVSLFVLIEDFTARGVTDLVAGSRPSRVELLQRDPESGADIAAHEYVGCCAERDCTQFGMLLE